MKLFELISERRWVPVVGYVFYILALTAGYYYNLTFVQLGLIDLGTRLVGMTSSEVSTAMALLALTTVVVAVLSGVVMDRRAWSTDLRVKLRILLAIVAVQLALTAIAPSIRTSSGFLAWIVVCSATLGVGIPVMFGTMIDFIPVRDRGYVAAIVAGLAFFIAALFPFEWRIEEFSVHDVCEGLLNMFRPLAEKKNIDLTATIAPGIPVLRQDANKLQQILWNLLSNAIKFTRAGGAVTLRAQISAEDELILQVSDTGIGMREEDLHRVLEPFVQVENELTRRYEGTGLGLSLSKQLIELHGGRIAIVSTPEVGTTVTAYLPASRLRRS